MCDAPASTRHWYLAPEWNGMVILSPRVNSALLVPLTLCVQFLSLPTPAQHLHCHIRDIFGCPAPAPTHNKELLSPLWGHWSFWKRDTQNTLQHNVTRIWICYPSRLLFSTKSGSQTNKKCLQFWPRWMVQYLSKHLQLFSLYDMKNHSHLHWR